MLFECTELEKSHVTRVKLYTFQTQKIIRLEMCGYLCYGKITWELFSCFDYNAMNLY